VLVEILEKYRSNKYLVIKKNKIILNIICILFVVISIFLLIESEESKRRFIAGLAIIFFGGLGIVYNINKSEKSGSLAKSIASMIGCLIFVILSYYILPIHHLFDGSRKYSPTIGWIFGIVGILFFGFGFLKILIELIKGKKK
jgi:riboflavin transporter FmnP